MLLKRGRYMGKGGRGLTCPHWWVSLKDSPHKKILVTYPTTATHMPVQVWIKLYLFLKILKQQIMVRTFSTLFQTMMRCYSSLRAGRGHIYFPNPVQQVIPKDSHGLSYMKHFDSKWTKTWVENREQEILQNGMVTAGGKN